METPVQLLSPKQVARRVARLAMVISPRVDDDTVVIALLTGGMWFAADLTRALYRLGRNPGFDALWLSSYGDARRSSGKVRVHAGLQRSLAGRRALVVDDVLESGASLDAARRLVLDAGAVEVLSAVFARKPWPSARSVEADFVGWDAPNRFLAGYGMDLGGRYRGLPGVAALD